MHINEARRIIAAHPKVSYIIPHDETEKTFIVSFHVPGASLWDHRNFTQVPKSAIRYLAWDIQDNRKIASWQTLFQMYEANLK